MTENETSLPNEPSDTAEPLVITDSSPSPRSDDPRPVAARTLAVMAPIVQFGLLALGVLYFVESVSYLTSDSMFSADQRFRIRTNAVALLAFFGLLGWVAAGLLKGAAAVIIALADQARAAERTTALVEGRLAAAFDRLAEALERVPTLGAAVGPGDLSPEVADPKVRHLAEFHAAVQAGHWYQAAELAASFAARYPDDPQGAQLGDELAEAKQTATHSLLAKIDAARGERPRARP
jgi:hypothetical protein